MKTWRIHLVWSVITLVSSAAWAQRVVRSRDIEFRDREKLLQVKLVESKKAAAAFVAVAPLPPPPSPIAAFEVPERAEPEYELMGEKRPTVEELRRLIESGGNEVWEAYQVLSRMVKGTVKTELVHLLFKHKDAGVRRAAIHMLREAIGDAAAAPLLQESLRSDPDAAVREAVAQCLGYHEAPGNVEALLQAFQKNELPVQLACAVALSDLGQPATASLMVPRFVAMLKSPDGGVRREAIASLSNLRCPEALPLLTDALRDSNADVRLEALSGLYNFDEALLLQIPPLVEPLLQDPVGSVRESAKSMLAWLKDQREYLFRGRDER